MVDSNAGSQAVLCELGGIPHSPVPIPHLLGKDSHALRTSAAPDQGKPAVTVRMPESLHTYLKREAHQLKTNINQLALAKLSATSTGRRCHATRRGIRRRRRAMGKWEWGMGNDQDAASPRQKRLFFY